jgi:hypothetical protein
LGFPLSPQGASYLGSLVFVPDSVHAGFLSLLRGYSQPELASSVLDFLHLDSPLLLQASGYMDSSTFAFSEIRLGSLPFALDFVTLGPFPPLRGAA